MLLVLIDASMPHIAHTAQLWEKPPAKFYKSSFCSGSAFNQRANQQRRRRRRPIRSVRAQRHQYE